MENLLNRDETERIIQMAWEDRTPFEAIKFQFGLNESDFITLMRSNMKQSSFVMWRTRVAKRKTKNQSIRNRGIDRFMSSGQKKQAIT